METNWAAEHLQTIRTLMERSAVYRRALAPIMIWNGVIGLGGGLIGWKLNFQSDHAFINFWNTAALLAIAGSFLLVRRQALKSSEPLWSPPTRRIAQAVLPPLAIGAIVNSYSIYTLHGKDPNISETILTILWLYLYGCAAHAAGFFMPRGMKLFAWVFILAGVVLSTGFAFSANGIWQIEPVSPSLLMATTFGGLHLAYGVYLYLTEKGKNAA